MSKQTWTIWSYDVWGNAKDGYDVNDRRKEGTIELPKDATDRQIIKAMKDEGWIKKRIHYSSIEVDGDDMRIEISEAKNGYPVYGLELNQ